MEKGQKKYLCVTKLRKEKISYKWMIQDYHLINMKPKEYMESPIFKSSENDKFSWRLRFYPQGASDESGGFTSFCLEPVSYDDSNFSMQCEFLILNGNGCSARKNEIRVLKQVKLCGTQCLVKNDELFNESNNLLPDNNLTLVCNITLCINNNRINSQTETRGIGNLQFSLFNNRLQLLLESKELSDVILVTSNGEELRAHKALLAAQSPVFMEMFKNESKKKRTTRIEEPEFDLDIVSDMLQYIYTGKFKTHGENLFKLSSIADKYAIEELKNNCELLLGNNLSLNNVIKTLILAFRLNMEFLKERAATFFVTHIKDIVKLPDYTVFKASQPLIWKSLILWKVNKAHRNINKKGNKRKIGEMN